VGGRTKGSPTYRNTGDKNGAHVLKKLIFTHVK
jgi:hypothetical protein